MSLTWVAASDRADALAALGIHEVAHRCQRCGSLDHGQPYADGVRGLSLSHAGGVTLAVRSEGPVGIDHEVLGTPLARDVVAHPSEDADALSLWVRKEAALKATGLGLQVDPASFWIHDGRVGGLAGYDGPPLEVVDLEIEGFVAALAAAPVLH